MSLITCCPACTTTFKVVPDQLKISDGWVRCGHCSEIFDATARLQDQEPFPDIAVAADAADAAAATPAATPAMDQTAQTDSAPVVNRPYPPFVLVRADTGDSEIPRERVGFITEPALLQDEIKPRAAPEPPPRSASRQQPRATIEPEAELEPTHDDVAFVRQARRRMFWEGPGVQASLLTLAVTLGALLALQLAFNHRDRLVAAQPALRPWVEMICRPPACSVAAPRHIEAVVVDSSTFSTLRSGAYLLNFTLKNQAPMAVAMPSIELTLTDTQDQPVLRRVVLPAEMGAKLPAIAAASEWSGTLAFSVAANENSGSAARITGYRLLAFYP